MWDHYSVPTYIKFLKHSLDLIQELSHQHLTPQPQMKNQEGEISRWNMNERGDALRHGGERGFIATPNPHACWVLGCLGSLADGQTPSSPQRTQPVIVRRNGIWDWWVWKERGVRGSHWETPRAWGKRDKAKNLEQANTRQLCLLRRKIGRLLFKPFNI